MVGWCFTLPAVVWVGGVSDLAPTVTSDTVPTVTMGGWCFRQSTR